MTYKQGDVFLAKLYPAKGTEPGKNRPVIIIQNNALNELGYPTCIVIPCSSKKMPKTSLRPELKEPFFKKQTYALLDQIRTIDVQARFVRKIGSLSKKNLRLILENFVLLIEN